MAPLAVVAALAVASGYEVNTQSAAATGQGGAVTASVAGPEAVFYNPAGLVNVGGTYALLGVTTLVPTVGYASPSGATAIETRVLLPPSAFVGTSVTPRFAVGIGLYAPIMLDVEWPAAFEARYDARTTQITGYTIAPTVAYRLLPELSLGLGLAVTRLTMLHERALNFIDQDGLLRVGGGGWLAGVNAGAQWSLLKDRLHVGLTFRSGGTAPINGRADFQVPIEFQQVMPDQTMTSSVDVPGELVFGVSGLPWKRLSIGAEASVGFWQSHSTWQIAFPNQPALNISEPRAYADPMSFRVGAQLTITDAWRLRAGGGYEPSPIQNTGLMPSMPDGDHVYVSGGVGYALLVGWPEAGQHVFFDVGYTFAAVRTRQSAPPAYPASYAGNIQMFGLSISEQWPK